MIRALRVRGLAAVRRLAAALGALLCAVLVAGCDTGPSQLGAAAIVGDTKISLEFVQSWWSRVLADRQLKEQVRASGNFDELSRAIVTEAVRHELIRRVATREGLAISEVQVSELIDSLGGEQAAVEATRSLYDRSTIRERARDQLLSVALGRKYFSSTSVRYDYTVVGSRPQALAKARELAADPARAQSIIEADGRAGAQVGFNRQQSIADSVDMAVNTPLFSVPAGHVLAFPDTEAATGAGQGQWLVALIRERSTSGPATTAPGATTLDRVNEGRLAEIGQRLLALLARDIEVKVNPRFGVWSDVYLAVLPNEGEVPAIVVPVHNPAG